MTTGRHDLPWTVVAGYGGSASAEDGLAVAQSVLDAALQATAPVRAVAVLVLSDSQSVARDRAPAETAEEAT